MILFMVFGVIFAIIVAFKGEESLLRNDAALNPFFDGTYVLLLGSVAFALLFPIFGFFTDVKKGMYVLIAILVLLALFGLSYIFSSNEIVGEVYEKNEITPGLSKLIGAGLLTTYILAALAIIAVAVSSVTSLFKR